MAQSGTYSYTEVERKHGQRGRKERKQTEPRTRTLPTATAHYKTCNVITGPCNVNRGPWNVIRLKHNVTMGPRNVVMDRGM